MRSHRLVNEDQEVQDLRERLAECEKALQDERTRMHRLEAEALYMQTAAAKYVPPSSYLHPSATACTANEVSTGNSAVAQPAGDDMVTISREAYELLHLKDRAMDSIKEGITIADCSLPDMPLIYVNEGFERITGWPVAEVQGKNCRFLQGDMTDDENLQQLREAVSQGKACQVSLTNYRKNGDAFVNYLSVTPVHNSQGLLTHYVGVQSDITELVNYKKSELAAKHQAVQAAAATEAKSQFLARMSHEIRTPLNGMIAVGQLLGETALTASQRDLLNTIRCSGETLLILITDILDFSRIEANKMVLSLQHFKLRTVVESALEIAGLSAAQKRLQVCYHIAEDVPTSFLGDPQRLQQILLNVLNNAVKFTESGEVLLEVWMGATEANRLEGTGYPLEIVKDVAEERQKTLESFRRRGGLPQPRQSLNTIRRENVETFIRAESGSEMPGTPTSLNELCTSSQVDLLPDSPSCQEQKSASLSSSSRNSSTGEQGKRDDAEEANSSFSNLPEGRTQTACGRMLPMPPGTPTMTHIINFAVRDTGIGISQDDLGSLFKLFSQVDSSRTRQHGGSGLGLSICKKLVEAMGGTMWGTSDGKDKGSTFHFSIRCPIDVAAGSLLFQHDLTSSFASSSTDSSSQSDPGEVPQGPASQLPSRSSQGDDAQEVQENDIRSFQGDDKEPGTPGEVSRAPSTRTQHASSGGVHARRSEGMRGEDGAGGCLEAGPAQRQEKGTKKENIRELRQVLNDILPGGVDSTAISKNPSSELTLRVKPLGCEPRSTEAQSAAEGPATAVPIGEEVFYREGAKEGLSLESGASSRSGGSLADTGGINGKKVLLVEPHQSVRHCMLLYLRGNGAHVKAVCSEDQAISCLRLQGAVTRKVSYDHLPKHLPEEIQAPAGLHLDHAPELDDTEEDVVGPFDVVVTDVKQSRVCDALIQAAASEAQRLVFMSWPGEREVEGQKSLDDPPVSANLVDPDSLFSQRAARPLSPPKAVREDMRHRTTTRQLGYVTIFRPIRQERLKQAIEAVLRTPLDAVSTGSDASGLLEVHSHARITSLSRHSSAQDLRKSVHSSSSSSSISHMTLPRNLRVLLAEDNIINLKVALGILHRIGFSDVVCAADGVKAIAEITSRGGGEAFDIVLTDLHMPRKGGMELVKEIRETWPESNVKIVAVTADAFEDTRNLCLAAGFDGWLAKPFRIQDLARVMDLVLANRSPFKSPGSQTL